MTRIDEVQFLTLTQTEKDLAISKARQNFMASLCNLLAIPARSMRFASPLEATEKPHDDQCRDARPDLR